MVHFAVIYFVRFFNGLFFDINGVSESRLSSKHRTHKT